MSADEDKSKGYFFELLAAPCLFYYLYKGFEYLKYWLKHDETSPDWYSESICNVVNLFCHPHTGYKVIDNALFEIGDLNITWLALALMIISIKLGDWSRSE